MAGSSSENTVAFPGTIDVAVNLVLSRMSGDTKAWLRRFQGDESDLRLEIAAGLAPAMSVRAMLGLWGQNPALLSQLPPGDRHPDSASTYFLIECWRRLRVEEGPAERAPDCGGK
jgi:hypothetical protein